MRVVILGSGVVGVASAWYLNQAGHEVTVIDREPGAALETSAANAGQISPGYAAPWAAPGVPLKAIKWMFQRHAPLAVRLAINTWLPMRMGTLSTKVQFMLMTTLFPKKMFFP